MCSLHPLVFLCSENRPEFFISDVAIMSAGAITVPAYTTYTENDYKYLIEDCEPTVVILSNNLMHKKLEKTIKEKNFIKKIITFDIVVGSNSEKKYLEPYLEKALEKLWTVRAQDSFKKSGLNINTYLKEVYS